MDLNFFIANLNNPVVLIPEIYKCHNSYYNEDLYRKQYDSKKHKINDIYFRPDKEIQLQRANEDGTSYSYTKTVPVTRIALSYQELLTVTANAFLTSGKVNLKANPKEGAEQNTYDRLLKIWRDEKLDFKNNQIGQSLYSETECAEIWYKKVKDKTDGTKEIQLKCNVYSPKTGYKLIPVFDEYDDLIAFARAYTIRKGYEETDHIDVYTDTELRRYVKSRSTEWILMPYKQATEKEQQEDSVKLAYGKIPVVFYQIDKPIWANSQSSIERRETLKSNHSDQNDYSGSPILAASGKILGMSTKGETGKVFELEDGAKLEYVQATGAPESVKMELEGNENDIFGMAMQADLSAHAMAKITGQLSGPIMDRLLIAPHTFAKNMQKGVYGLGIQRRVNFLISAICAIYPECRGGEELSVTPEYDLFRIGSESDMVDLLLKANGGKAILSQEESINQNPLSDDPTVTFKKIQDEEKTQIIETE